MSGPFDGVVVVEFGQFVVVPFCAQLLADSGARVIKVEPLTGDSYRSGRGRVAPGLTRQFLIKNRGKESVAIDLGNPESREVVSALVRLADVVLVNMSPSAIERRGLDYESLRKDNPRLIYANVSAFGHVGPEAALPGMDVVVQARSGLLTTLGAERDGVPFHSEAQVADYATSLLLYGGVAAALYARATTGVGQHVATSLLAGALVIQNNSLAHVPASDHWQEDFVEKELPRLRRAGASHDEIRAYREAHRADPALHTQHYRAFRTENGFVAVGAGSPASRARLAAELGIDNSLLDTDPAAFGRTVAEKIAGGTTEHWIDVLRAAAVPVSIVKNIDELLFDRHAMDEGLIAEYEHDRFGTYRGFGVPIQFSATPMEAAQPAASLGEHTAAVLAEIGFTTEQIKMLVSSGAVATGETPSEGGVL